MIQLAGGDLENVYVGVAIVGGVGAAVAVIEKRWKVVKGWWAQRKAREELLFGSPAVMDSRTGHIIRAAVPSLAERLDAGDKHFIELDASIQSIRYELTPNGGGTVKDEVKETKDAVCQIAASLQAHISDSEAHAPAH